MQTAQSPHRFPVPFGPECTRIPARVTIADPSGWGCPYPYSHPPKNLLLPPANIADTGRNSLAAPDNMSLRLAPHGFLFGYPAHPKQHIGRVLAHRPDTDTNWDTLWYLRLPHLASVLQRRRSSWKVVSLPSAKSWIVRVPSALLVRYRQVPA